MKKPIMLLYLLCGFILVILPAEASENIDSPQISSIFKELKNRDYDKAISQCQKLNIGKNRDYIYFLEGLAHHWKGENQKAVYEFTQAIQLNNQRGEAFFYRGLANANLRNIEQAFNDFDHTFTINNTPAQIASMFIKMGWKYSTDRLRPNVKSGWQKSRSAFGLPPIADELAAKALMFYSRSRMYSEKKSYDSALKDISAAIDTWPFETANSGYYELKGHIHMFMYQLEDSSKACKTALAINPKSLKAMHTLGMIEFYRGNYSECIQLSEKALDLNSSDFALKMVKGISYWLSGQQEKGIQELENLLLQKEHVSLRLNLAYIYHLKDMQEKALEYFQKSYGLDKKGMLSRKQFLLNVVPAASPTRAFYEKQYETAELYVSRGKTPREVEQENRLPSLEINVLNTTPETVRVNTPFKINLSFTPDLKSDVSDIDVRFTFTITQDEKILFHSKEINIQGKNRTMIHYQARMGAVPKAGSYLINAEVKKGKLSTRKLTSLIIK